MGLHMCLAALRGTKPIMQEFVQLPLIISMKLMEGKGKG